MENIKDIKIEKNVSLKNYNTYRIDAKSDYLVEVYTIEALKELISYIKSNNLQYKILGNGSNIILDDYFKGIIIKLNGLNYVNIDQLKVVVGAGTMMGMLAKETINNNLSGLEWTINIPGTVGGSIVCNAGAYNSEMFDDLVEIKVLNKNLEVIDMKKEEFLYQYRETNIRELNLIVLEGTF